MQTNDLWSFINIGTGFRYLQDVLPTHTIHGKACVLWNIDRFFKELDRLNLHVTKRASKKLEKMRVKLSKTPKRSQLGYVNAREISEIIEDIRKTFKAEATGRFIFTVIDKRIDTDKLLHSIDKLFSPGIFNACPSIAQYDFREAGKCIAFERPTAAAFHTLRGTESVIRTYYKRFIPSATGQEMWGSMIIDLRKITGGIKPDKILLEHLDHIRDSFRNPTQHPEKTYDIEEAQDLFNLCVDAVNRMNTATRRP